MGKHSILAPSSAARRVQCPGSAVLEFMHPETERSQAAMEGDAAHELAEWMLDLASRAAPGYPTLDEALQGSASNGVPFTEEMYEAARLYADDIAAVMRSTGIFGGQYLGIEDRVHSDRIHDKAFGTVDCWLYDPVQKHLRIWDFKFGHAVVDAENNWQLIDYAAGLVDRMTGASGYEEQQLAVTLNIVQPRAFHRDGPVRRWQTWPGALRAHWNQLRAVEHEALGPNPTYRTGAECKHCNARHVCETLQRAAYEAAEYVGQGGESQLDGPALAVELSILRKARETLSARIDGLEAQAEGLIRNGDTVPGYALEAGRGRKRWRGDLPRETLFAIGDGLGVDLRKPVEPITPNQAAKRGIDESVIRRYSETPQTGLKLVEASNTKAHKIFAKG